MLTREVKPARRSQTANAQPASFSVGLTYRTAVCGPACTVVWQGRRGDSPPYADFADVFWPVAKLERHVTVTHAMRRFESCPASQFSRQDKARETLIKLSAF